MKIGAATKAAGAPKAGAYDSKSTSCTKSASMAVCAARKALPSRVSRYGPDTRLVPKSTFLPTV